MSTAMEQEFRQKFNIPSSSPPHLTPTRRDSKMPAATPIKQESPEQDFSQAWSSTPTPAPAAAAAAPTEALTQYTPHQLRKIGSLCSNRLPPANAVQGMFLYEMQRQSELESLFHGSIFRIAKQEDATTAQNKRTQALEERLAHFEKQYASRDAEERLTASKTAMTQQNTKMEACTDRVTKLETKLVNISDQMEAVRKAQETAAQETAAKDKAAALEKAAAQEAAAKVKAAKEAAAATPAKPSANTEEISTMKEEIDVLFGDRDGMIEMITEIKGRLGKLEDNLRSLTLQNTAAPTTKVPPPHQSIALQQKTAFNSNLALDVPKGKPHVGLNKENRPAATVRSFSPGKQWAT